MGMTMRAMEMVAVNVHRHIHQRRVILTALQLQRADLSVHGVLGQVHVAGNRCRNAVVTIKQKIKLQLVKLKKKYKANDFLNMTICV